MAKRKAKRTTRHRKILAKKRMPANVRKAEAAKVSASHPTMRDAKLIAREVRQAKADLGCRTR